MTNGQAGAGMSEMPPAMQLMQLGTGCMVTQAVFVAAKLGIADELKDGPLSTTELAEATGTNESALYRLMRSLASVGAFTATGERTFANTPMTELLRSDVPGSMRDMVLWINEEPHWVAYAKLIDSVRTGETIWEDVHGEPLFPYLFETNKELGDTFNRAMTSFSSATIPAILEAYDFSGAATIADIAGGYGHLLAGVLNEYPEARGVLFEVPQVMAGAPAMMEKEGVADRVTLVEGSFTEEIPVAADVYMLKHIIHDWYDDTNEKILRNIRNAMPDDARVLLIDAVVPAGNEPHFSKILDLEMLMLPGGMERTAAEFESLLEKSGFKMTKIVPTASPVSIVEAVKA